MDARLRTAGVPDSVPSWRPRVVAAVGGPLNFRVMAAVLPRAASVAVSARKPGKRRASERARTMAVGTSWLGETRGAETCTSPLTQRRTG